MANPNIVQQAHGSNGSGNASATLTNAPASGNLILVAISANTTPTSVKDNAGTPNSYTKAASFTSDGVGAVCGWFYFEAGAGLPSSYQVTTAGCSFCAVEVFELSGLATSTPIDATDAGKTGNSTTPAGDNLTTSNTDLIAFVGEDAGNSDSDSWSLNGTSTTAGWVESSQDVNTNQSTQGVHVAFLPNPNGSNAGEAAGTITGPGWSMAAGSAAWATQGVALKVVSGGGTNWSRTISSSIAHSATISRQAGYGRTVSSGIANTVSVGRQAGYARSISSSIAHAAALSRVYGAVRQVASSITHVATMGRLVSYTRTVASSIAHVASITYAGQAPNIVEIARLWWGRRRAHIVDLPNRQIPP